MKLFYVLSIVSSLVISIKAECDCDVEDVVCLQSCVQKGNQCISECEDSGCFSSCVDDHWPGPDLNYPYPESMSFTSPDRMSTRSETPSYATMTKSAQWQSTESSFESNRPMSSNWNPSSIWSAAPSYTNSIQSPPPSSTNSLPPNVSISGPVSSSTSNGQKVASNDIVSILGLGLTIYLLYLN